MSEAKRNECQNERLVNCLKVYWASYYQTFGCGAHESADLIITANAEQEALGLALERYTHSKADWWSFEEIDCTKLSVTDIDFRSS